jgi:hypothetical protein
MTSPEWSIGTKNVTLQCDYLQMTTVEVTAWKFQERLDHIREVAIANSCVLVMMVTRGQQTQGGC